MVKPVMVEAPDYSGRYSVVSLGGSKFRIEDTMIGLIEFTHDKLYIYNYQSNKTTVYWTRTYLSDVALRQRMVEHRPLVFNGKLQGYNIFAAGPDRTTNIFIDGHLRHTIKGICL